MGGKYKYISIRAHKNVYNGGKYKINFDKSFLLGNSEDDSFYVFKGPEIKMNALLF